MNLIGISGVAGAGKDTVADFLVRDFGFVKVALADPMKRACAEWFNWDEETLWGPSSKRNEPHARLGGLTARKALQLLGTEFGRVCYPNVWVDQAIRAAYKLLGREPWGGTEPSGRWMYNPQEGAYRLYGGQSLPKISGVVIADCRFPNEVEAIKAAGGKVWRILRPQKSKSVLRREGAMQGLSINEVLKQEAAWQSHVSEHSLDDWADDRFDMIINNEGGSLEDLRGLVKAAMEASR